MNCVNYDVQHTHSQITFYFIESAYALVRRDQINADIVDADSLTVTNICASASVKYQN